MIEEEASDAVAALHDLSATDLIAGFRARQFSPSEVLDDVLAHIAQWEPHIKALYAFDPEGARAAAKASSERWQKGEAMGPLDGIPVTIKDNIATKGVPLPLGTAALKLVPAQADAPPAARLREAGAIIFSKTTMPDFGMLSSGLSSFHPLTRNPWDLRQNPGGSSAGAGAACAAGYGPLHLGTDIGGSVRLPAGWCGLVGLKPSLGRVPIDPPYVGRVAGPITRTVDDAALMMSVMAKPDRRDGMSLPANDIHWKTLDKPSRKLRIGLLLDLGVGQTLEQDVRDVAVKAAKAFEATGAAVSEVKGGVLTREMLDGLDNFWRARLWDDLSKLSAAERDKTLPYILRWAEAGAKLSGVDVIRGFNATMAIRAAAAKLFADIDYLISPVSPVVKFAAELAAPLNDPDRPFEHIAYTVPWNMAENPAISINGGYDADGFPIGLQIIGRRFDDLGVLSMAKAFESLRGPQRRWPSVPKECGSLASSWPGLSRPSTPYFDEKTWMPGTRPGMTASLWSACSESYAALAFRLANASRISGRRSLPKYMSVLSRKIVGEPNPPRAITSSVLALSASLIDC
jgi:aspartyl-tRNA(Asn)/glutamyl-tRNA(Gln) amidotransferase subunit A